MDFLVRLSFFVGCFSVALLSPLITNERINHKRPGHHLQAVQFWHVGCVEPGGDLNAGSLRNALCSVHTEKANSQSIRRERRATCVMCESFACVGCVAIGNRILCVDYCD